MYTLFSIFLIQEDQPTALLASQQSTKAQFVDCNKRISKINATIRVHMKTGRRKMPWKDQQGVIDTYFVLFLAESRSYPGTTPRVSQGLVGNLH